MLPSELAQSEKSDYYGGIREVRNLRTKEAEDGSYEYRARDNSGRRDVVICEVHWGDEGEA